MTAGPWSPQAFQLPRGGGDERLASPRWRTPDRGQRNKPWSDHV